MINTCLNPKVSRKFAEDVINAMTPEQREKYGININDNTDKEGAIMALSAYAGTILNAAPSEEQQNKVLDNPERFISFLDKYALNKTISQDDIEEVNDACESIFGTTDIAKIGTVWAESDDTEDVENKRKLFDILSNLGIAFVYQHEFKDEEGTEWTCFSYVLSNPVAEEKSAQQKTVDQITKIAGIDHSKFPVKYEIVKDSDNTQTNWVDHTWDIPKGWHRTGNTRYNYNGQIIYTSSITGYSDADYPILSGPIGNQADKVGKFTLGESATLFQTDDEMNIKHDDKGNPILKSDKELQTIIDTQLGGIFTVQGLKNLIGDFLKLKEQIKDAWGENSVFITDEITLFAKTGEKDKEGNELWKVGKPDLIVVGDDGIAHVLDFKTMKMRDIQSYNSIYSDSAEKYSLQESSYIRMLQSHGVRTDENAYIVQVDTYYDSSDYGREKNEGHNDRKDVYYYQKADKKTGSAEVMGILDDNGGLSQTLGEYAAANNGIIMDAEGRGALLNPQNDAETALGGRILYLEPRLRIRYDEETGKFSDELAAIRGGEKDSKSGIVFKKEVSYAQQFASLSEKERKAVADLFGKPVGRSDAQGIVRLSEQNVYSRPELITPQEIANVAESIAYYISDMISFLAKGESFDNIPLSQSDNAEGEPHHTPLMGLSRKQIIERVGIDPLIDAAFQIVEGHYDEEMPTLTEEEYEKDEDEWYKEEWKTYEDYKKDKSKSDKAAWLLTPAHREQIISLANAKLRSLENYFVPVKNTDNPTGLVDENPNIRPENDTDQVEEDTGDNETNEYYADALLDGTTDILAWMVGQRNYSPRASLAKEVRRRFESLYMLDDNGEHIHDPYGWGYATHVDPTMAIQAIFDICNNCETMDEMMNALEIAVEQPDNRWIQQIIDTINSDDSFKKKFFSQFRKDRLIYTISEAKLDKNTGSRIVVTRVINMHGAVQTMRNSLGSEFYNHKVGAIKIDGKTYSLVAGQDGENRLVKYDNGEKTVAQFISTKAGKIKNEIDKIYKAAYKINKKGIVAKDRIKFINKELLKGVDELDGDSVIKALTDCLNGIGIMVPQDVVVKACTVIALGDQNSNARALVEHITRVVGSLRIQGKKNSLPDSIAGLNAFKSYNPIINILASHVQEYVESNVYQDGKTYYSFTNPSKLGHIVRNCQDALNDNDKFEKYIQDNFGRYTGWYKDRDGNWLCDWIGQFENNKEARKAFRHHVELSYIGTQYKSLGALGFQLSILHNYFGSRDDQIAHPDYRYFALPTMSNKPVNEFLRMLKYKDNDVIIDRVLMNTFKQEINRIADVLYHYANNDTAVENMDITDKIMKNAGWEDQIDDLKERINNHEVTVEDIVKLGSMNGKLSTGAKFHFLWYLNSELANNQALAEGVTAMINELLTFQDDKDNNANSSNNADTLAMVREAIVNNMENIVDDELQRMKDIGLFETETRNIRGKKVEVLKYQEEFGKNLGWLSPANPHYSLADSIKAMENALKEFIWQDIAANINIIQITGGDLAYYGNSINYQKRIAQMHSPGIHFLSEKDDPNGHDDGYLRSVHIADAHVREEIKYNTEAALNSYLDSNRNNMNPDAVKDYEKMITLVVNAIKDALATDGQSFSSPTSIRKKLALQGDWDDVHEEAYKRICKGDFNINDLGIMLQPSKPFVTSDMAKYSGSPTMDIRRVPLQDKNSEYLLLLADALGRGMDKEGKGKRNKFAAIYDFMEKTAHELDSKGNPDYSEPNRHGIDTVHFASVCKVGASGVLDINAFDAAFEREKENRMANGEKEEDIEAEYNSRLTDFLYESVRRPDPNDVTNSAENQRLLDENDYLSEGKLKQEEVLYNTKYVDTIAVDDYIIQQEVPIHEFERGTLWGSQIRILGISDITPGTEFNVYSPLLGDEDRNNPVSDTALVREYKNLHAANIRASFNSVIHELGFDILKDKDNRGNITFKNLMDLSENDPDRKEVLQNIEYLLQKELSKDSKFDPDTQMACTLNAEKTDFTVPLMDPIQSKRIQMLLNSIIKKSINKEMVTGGSVVQTTAYDRDLHIRFQDKNGNELMTLQEFQDGNNGSVEEYKKYLKENQAGIKYFECYMPVPNAAIEKLITNEDGSIMSVEEVKRKVGDKVWESISRIIGYRIPTEDKYSMLPLKIKGFMPKAAGQVIMMPQEITFLTGSDFDIDKMYLMMKALNINTFENKPKDIVEAYRKDHNGVVFSGIEDIAKQVAANATDILNGSEIAWDSYTDINDGQAAVDKFNKKWAAVTGKKEAPNKKNTINKFIEWYKDFLLKNAFSEYSNLDSKNSYSARRARNNRILDLQWAVLTNKDTTSKMLNPGNFNEEKKIGRIIRITKAEIINPETTKPWTMQELKEKSINDLDEILANYADPHNTTLPSSKIYYQNQNMQGTQMTGIFANNNVSHAFCSFQRIVIDLDKSSNKTFCLDGVEVGNPKKPIILDRQKGFNGQYISKTLASLLAASVDTAKDPVHRDLNINTFTGNVAATLARLGFDIETIGLFLSQPVLVDLSDLYFRKSTDGFYRPETAISEFRSSLEISDENWKELSPIQKDSTFTKESLFEALSNKDYQDNAEDFNFQKNVLKLFNVLYSMSKDIQELTFCTKFNSVANAGGPTIADSMQDVDRVNTFTSSEFIEKSCFYEPKPGDSQGYTSVRNVIENDPILKAFYYYTVGKGGAAEVLFKSFFPHYYKGFNNVVAYFKENFLGKSKMTSKIYNQLLDDYIYYLLTYNNKGDGFKPVIPASQKEQDYLVKGLVKRFLQLSNMEGRRPNVLLDNSLETNCLRVRTADTFLKVDTLMFSSGGLNSDSQEKIKNAWSELITMNDPNLSDEENTMIRVFGRDLFFYTLMRNGFGFSPKTLMHLASVIVRFNATYNNGYDNYIAGLKSVKDRDEYLMTQEIDNEDKIEDFCNQFIRNHCNNRQLVPNVNEQDANIDYDSSVQDGSKIVFRVSKKTKYKLNPLMLDDKPRQFITVTGVNEDKKLVRRLYQLDSSNIGEEAENPSITYKEVEALGLTNNFIEYSANDDLKNSYYTKLRDNSEDSLDDEENNDNNNGDERKAELGDTTSNNDSDKLWNDVEEAISSAIRNRHINDSDTAESMLAAIKNASGQNSEIQQALNDFMNDKGDKKKIIDKIEDIIMNQNAC